MARLESVASLKTSGASFTILREGDDFATFTEDMLEEMRSGAEVRMNHALDHIVAAVRRVLSKRYPIIRAGGQRSFASTADPMLRRLRAERAGVASELRQSAPPGAPPGHITSGNEGLAGSWQRKKATWSKKMTVLTGRYFSRHPGAGRLEWGDPGARSQKAIKGLRKNAVAMPSHPYIRPTLAREAAALDRILEFDR